ncbi:hypothetical protein LXL04_011052 [Taraxacum kok-saghyz]
MVAPLFTFVPNDAVDRAANTPSTPIYITTNNVAFTPIIPDSLQDQGLEVYLQFIQSHPLRYAFTEIPLFLPKHICEFYYSCTYDASSYTVNGTIADGQQQVTISPSTFRNALRLPIFHDYPPHPSDAECRTSLPRIAYNLALQGTRSEKFILRQCLPAGWKLITGIIGKCLGHKTGSLDQLNLFELRILHALVADQQYDFGGLFFNHFVETISGRARPQYVTFPRFIGLLLEHLGNGYAGEIGDDMRCPTSSPRLFSAAPQPNDPPTFPHMLNWIDHPYTAEPRPVDFMPMVVEPLAQQAGDQDQPAGEAEPQHTDETQLADDATTTSNASSSSPERQSPIHLSTAATASGNTSSVHLTQSESSSSFSHPSSESPLITPYLLTQSTNIFHQILRLPILLHLEGSHITASQPTYLPSNLNHKPKNSRLIFNVAAIKNHLLPDQNIHHTQPPPPPPPSPPGQPPRQQTPPHVSDSLSQSDAEGEKLTAEQEQNRQLAVVEGESQQKPAQAEGEHSQQPADDSYSSSSDDEEGFLDISFLNEDHLPLITGELSDVESDEEGSLETRKRKRSDADLISADPSGAGPSSTPLEAGPSSSAGPSSPPKKKRRTIEEIAADFGMSVEEARKYQAEHIAALHNIAIEAADDDVVKEIAAEEGGESSQLKALHQFEAAAAKKQKISNILDRMDAKRYANVQNKRYNPDPIIKVRCTKPKREKRLSLHITRAGPVQQYTESLFASELQKYGLSVWLQIKNIIATHQGINAKELKIALNQLIENCQRLKLIPAAPAKPSSAGTSSVAPKRSKSKHISFLLPYGTRYINNKLPAGVEPVQYLFIRQPEHGMFYMDANFQMCFQRTSDLPAAPTEHLYHLRLECMGHPEQEGFFKIIAVELESRSQELLDHEEMYWMKDEILSDAEKARLEALVD